MRFGFGKNWQNYATSITPARIDRAIASLKRMLRAETLQGRSFLDIGSGSGLFSLAARELGARVHSFDYDPDSVACTRALQNSHRPNDQEWHIEAGSVLDDEFLNRLGTFDVVYSWGVLHHTGDMWRALGNVSQLVRSGGLLYVAIYNDQGRMSRIWWHVKRVYNQLPERVRPIYVFVWALGIELASAGLRLLTLQNPLPLKQWQQHRAERGMSAWYDYVDWIGGFPFEVATPEAIFDFYTARGFRLTALATRRGRSGCCEYVFQKEG